MHLRSGRVLESENLAVTHYPSTLGSGPSIGTQGSVVQDLYIALSDSSSDYDVMEGYPTQNPENPIQETPALAPQPSGSMFSRLVETFSRATRSDLAPNEANEGMGEVNSPFPSRVDPTHPRSVQVDILPTSFNEGPIEQPPSEVAPAIATTRNVTTGNDIASTSRGTPSTPNLEGSFLNENWEYDLGTETLTDLYTGYAYHVGWLEVIRSTSSATSLEDQHHMICNVIHGLIQSERQNRGMNIPSTGPMQFLDTGKGKQPTLS